MLFRSTAENGHSNGGLVNFVTKSGTSQFKGSGWFNAKRDSWNANDYVRIRNSQEKPLYKVNIGGYSLGGPVIVPKILDSRTTEKKLFFFFSQEYTSDAKPSVLTRANAPTDLERAGDFSQTLTSTGALLPIIDPLTGKQFPGNIIPANRINSIGQKLLNLVQRPNGYVSPVASEKNSFNYVDNSTPLHNRTDHVLRVDTSLSSKTRFSTRLIADREDNIVYNQIGRAHV